MEKEQTTQALINTIYDRQVEIDGLKVQIRQLQEALVALETYVEQLETRVQALERPQDTLS